MNSNKTDVTIVLDRSGSMAAVADDTIGGFNRFLKEQRETPGEAALTLYRFDHEFEIVIQIPDIRKAEALTNQSFSPRGSTALLDAIGRAIVETGARLEKIPESQRPGKVVMVIITDGAENASREYTRSKVFEMIKHQREKYSWEFVFLGANQDAISTGMSIGIASVNNMTYAHNSAGTTAAFAAYSKNLRSFRVGQKVSMSFEPEDIKAQADAGLTATDKP